ncbi:hypothetical protein AX14_005398 [Amanita brunnescens Koide BX004]|nr:hypothetical protein AX14_005398 [Amanita brunnescens Koide BX004]
MLQKLMQQHGVQRQQLKQAQYIQRLGKKKLSRKSSKARNKRAPPKAKVTMQEDEGGSTSDEGDNEGQMDDEAGDEVEDDDEADDEVEDDDDEVEDDDDWQEEGEEEGES